MCALYHVLPWKNNGKKQLLARMQGENYNRNGVLAVCEQKLEKTAQNDRSRNEDCNEFTFHRTFIKIIQPTAAV